MIRKTLLVILIAICVQGCIDNPIRVNDINNNSIDTSNMTLIPEGTFMMGSYRHGVDGGLPGQWKEVYTDEYYIDKYEVTIGEYKQFIKYKNLSVDPYIGLRIALYLPMHYELPEDADSYPITNISWEEANEYAKWVGKSLPTEEQWEKAARGGMSMKRYSWGNNAPTRSTHKSLGNFTFWCSIISPILNSPRSPFKLLPVGESNPNGYELYDITGNASEMCNMETQSDNTPYKDDRMIFKIKGSSVKNQFSNCGSNNIDHINVGRFVYKVNTNLRSYLGGFRCVVSIEDILTE